MKTQTRVASLEYRQELDESNCCQEVWILGNSVLTLYDAAWFKTAAGMDIAMADEMEGLELEWAYWSRKRNKQMIVSESVIVSRRTKGGNGAVAGPTTAGTKMKNLESQESQESQEERDERRRLKEKEQLIHDTTTKNICSVFSSSFGSPTTLWTDVILFGGSADDRVARLAGSNGKAGK